MGNHTQKLRTMGVSPLTNKSRGMLLVTTLIIIAIMAMFMSVMLGDLKVGMYLSGNYAQQQQAYWGALSGLEYAKHMILLNWTWHGNSTAIPINASDVRVEEGYMVGGSKQYGAIHGAINNRQSEFYIAFADPSAKMGDKMIPVKDVSGNYLTYYSHNKLSTLYTSEVPIDDSGKSRVLPPRCVYVIVEGRSDRSRSYVEAIYTLDYSPSLPAAAISSGEMNIAMRDSSAKLLFTHAAGDNPYIRSNASIMAKDGSSSKKIIDLSAGKAVAKEKIVINDMEVNKNNQSEFGINAELNVDSSSAFPRLTWDSMMKQHGDPDDPASSYGARLKAGVYAFMEDPANKGVYNLAYFPEEFGDDFSPKMEKALPYKDYAKGITVPGDGRNMSQSNLQMVTDKKTAVEKVAIDKDTTLESFTLIAYDWDPEKNSYVRSTTARSKFLLQKNTDITQPTTLCSNGDVLVKGELSGTGSVISGSDLGFEPSSQLVPSPEMGLAIYTKGSINISDISAPDNCIDPNDYINEAINTYIKTNGTTFTSSYLTTYKILNTPLQTEGGQTSPLSDALAGKYGFSPWDCFSLVMKSLRENSEWQGSHYVLTPPTDPDYAELKPSDAVIKGVIYTWKDFNTNLYGGSLTVRGAVVAYGGDPASQSPGGFGDSGKLNIRDGHFVNIIYDPNYLALLGIEGLSHSIRQVMFNRL